MTTSIDRYPWHPGNPRRRGGRPDQPRPRKTPSDPTPRRRPTGRLVIAALAACVLGAVAGLVLVVSPDATKEAEAHGSVSVPASRAYSCRFEQPDNERCAAAWSANSQALYDWMEVNQPQAAGNHEALIPDGELCSAGRDKYAAFDTPGNWPLTALSPNSSGQHEIVYTNTAPHATSYYRIYVTAEGFDARTTAPAWSDMELVYDSGALAASAENRFTVTLPERTVPAILYVVWQRSDSPEAFYSCSDVTIAGGGSSGDATTTTAATSTTSTTAADTTSTTAADDSTSTTAADDTTTTLPTSDAFPFTPVQGIEVSATDTATWEGGYCREIEVSNVSSSTLSWEVHDMPAGTITSLWDAESEAVDHQGHQGHLRFVGKHYNERIAAGESTTFGMCVAED